MSLIQRIVNLLHLKQGMITVYILNTMILVFVSYQYHGVKDILYPIGVSLFILFVYLLIAAVGYHKFTDKLAESKVSPQIEVDDTNVQDKLIFSTINEIHEQYNATIFKQSSSVKERNTLFSQWIHNMKVSISIIGLASEQGSQEAIEDIKEENNKLMQNLEECLNVLRLDDFSRDYMPERVNLYQLVIKVINGKKRDFIYKGVYPKVYIDEVLEVYTDEKWCGYMIEQMLSNAIKYSDKDQQVTIRSEVQEDHILLNIQDNGIGIHQEDLPRVFDPFFTGRNGRDNRSATGIGLYMVKYIAHKLGHKVSIDSQKGVGTEVTLSFLSEV
ncbi:sensor histidine kinase [Paenibacillus segetis]|uniref:histidine kinase n=1 Tax=Paenibacillus segetis TaxID=1325360 RepID=A0ABQ1YFP6_9BACL|nr:sensor histidine kinase [Paenibacillus segetis]GGH23597.1 ATP-binding protein [Paenibacillus segetis]